ncbi:MAG: hypothetical protein AABZ94_03905 [Candidatus Eisenbacteria bacterium]
MEPPLLTRLARSIDATLLTAWATPGEIERVAEEACRLRVAAVCILPFHTRRAAAIVAGTGVAVRAAAPGCLTKWIVEQDALDPAELRRAVLVIGAEGGDFVKNATGYGPGGASVAGIRLLRSLAGTMGVKASGGIRKRDQALALLDAGADRIGTSAAAAILGAPERRG